MIFHSANNLRKRKRKKEKEKRKRKEKEKEKGKRKKKRKRKKERKRIKEGIKEFQLEPHAITVTWSIPFKHGQVILN
jgi:hypothetical protein